MKMKKQETTAINRISNEEALQVAGGMTTGEKVGCALAAGLGGMLGPWTGIGVGALCIIIAESNE